MKDRARSTGNPQGRWSDDKFIVEAEQMTPLTPGEHVINMGKPVGDVYLPNGQVLSGANVVKVIRKADGTIKTSYPFVN